MIWLLGTQFHRPQGFWGLVVVATSCRASAGPEDTEALGQRL